MRPRWLIGPTVAACVAMCASVVQATTTFSLVRTLVGGALSATPFSPLIADKAGDLFGTASAGGNGGCVTYSTTGCGTVFELIPPPMRGGSWTEKVLYSFPGGNGPWFPFAGLSMDASGDLFGMTTDGSPFVCFTKYCGTAFELSPPSAPNQNWRFTTLHRFSGGAGGSDPFSGLILDGNGNAYGTNEFYGRMNRGTVFRLSPPTSGHGWWTETVLSDFGVGGNAPIGMLAFDKTGHLFGTTFYGGIYDEGVVFELTPRLNGLWLENVLYQFGANACSPKTYLVFDANQNLYGTAQGCPALPGAVFRLARPSKPRGQWTESILARFNYGTNFDPSMSLALDSAGDVFGTTAGGGTYGYGTLFELKAPNWSQTILHSFKGWDGSFPTSGPIFGLGGVLYGTVFEGGTHMGPCKIGGCGVVYSLAP